MKITHRISKTLDSSMQQELRALGIEVEIGLATFEIEESHPSWSKVEELVAAWSAVDVVTTKFTAAELKSAAQLRMAASWHHGYPEPSDDSGYLQQSYDLTDFCETCGIEKRQTGALHMASEPKWGKRQVLQLNWLYDEFFVLPSVWDKVFQPFGISCEKVLHHGTGKPLETVVQLRIETLASSALDIPSNVDVEHCGRCSRKKFIPISRGEFPRVDGEINGPIVKSREYFGSGASAWQAVIVSAELFQAVKQERLKGVEFIPTSSVETSKLS